jgi:hypothetical protein
MWARNSTDQIRLSQRTCAYQVNCWNISFAKRGYWDPSLLPLPIHQIWLRLMFFLFPTWRWKGNDFILSRTSKRMWQENKFEETSGKLSTIKRDVEFETLSAVVMKSFIFWNVLPYSQLKIKRSFGETCRLHLQGRRICQSRNQGERVSIVLYLFHAGFLPGLLFDPEDVGDTFLRNVDWLSFNYTALHHRTQNSLFWMIFMINYFPDTLLFFVLLLLRRTV